MFALTAFRRTLAVHEHREEDGRELWPQSVRANPAVLCCGLRYRLLDKTSTCCSQALDQTTLLAISNHHSTHTHRLRPSAQTILAGLDHNCGR